MRIPL